MSKKTKYRIKKFFTLVEMLVVASVIGILMGMLLPGIAKAKKRAKYIRWFAHNAIVNRDGDAVLNYNFMYNDYYVNYLGQQRQALRNGAIGCTAKDFEPKDYDGILMNSPEWRIGKGRWGFNNALQFDGNNDYVLVPGKRSLNFNASKDEFSMIAWIYCDAINSNRMLFSKSEWPNDTQYDAYWASNRMRADLGTDNPSWTSPSLTASKWYQVAFVCASTGYYMYMNGQPMTGGPSSNKPPTKSVISDANFILGAVSRKNGTPNFYFQGRMDEFIMYQKALTPSEVKGNYKMGSGQ